MRACRNPLLLSRRCCAQCPRADSHRQSPVGRRLSSPSSRALPVTNRHRRALVVQARPLVCSAAPRAAARCSALAASEPSRSRHAHKPPVQPSQAPHSLFATTERAYLCFVTVHAPVCTSSRSGTFAERALPAFAARRVRHTSRRSRHRPSQLTAPRFISPLAPPPPQAKKAPVLPPAEWATKPLRVVEEDYLGRVERAPAPVWSTFAGAAGGCWVGSLARRQPRPSPRERCFSRAARPLSPCFLCIFATVPTHYFVTVKA